MLKREETALVMIDFQEKLFPVMQDKEMLLKNALNIIQGARALGIPVLWTEQNPKGMGATLPEIADLLKDTDPISKMSFSCCKNDLFMEKLKALNRRQILIGGIETHICVYQTTADLVKEGYDVEILADVVSSRTRENRQIGLQKTKDKGASATSVETALFELLKTAESEDFRPILKIIK
jgi:nicotinamidase-related amidase